MLAVKMIAWFFLGALGAAAFLFVLGLLLLAVYLGLGMVG